MHKNQLQELAQRSCFDLPAYACIREGPDHASRFKATVNFNGEIFKSPDYCNTLRQAEHAAAEVALSTLSRRGPSQSLAKNILDETNVCKNLLQVTAQRAGVSVPVYTTISSGPGHLPVFSSTVEVVGMRFTGETAKTKKQAEKNAAMAAWSALRSFANQGNSTLLLTESEESKEQEQNIIARVLAKAYGREETLSLPSKEQLENIGRSPVQRTIASSPSRVKSGSCDAPVPVSPGKIEQYHLLTWSPGELSNEPCQKQAHTYLYNPPHSSIMVVDVPPCHPVNVDPEQVSIQGSDRCHLSGPSGEAMAVNWSAIGTTKQVVLTQPRSETMKTKDRNKGSIAAKEHQQDEDEWLQRGSVVLKEHDPPNTANDTMWSRGSDPWWNYCSSSSSFFLRDHGFAAGVALAPPIRVRSVTAVCEAPPSHASLELLEDEQAVGSNSSGNDRTCEALTQLRI